MIDQTIAHYKITAKLGNGGMGEVYRARDSRLNREVAVKVLPERFASDLERMNRFSREAQVLASLNHPNIASIYGLEKVEGQEVLVMELVEGSAGRQASDYGRWHQGNEGSRVVPIELLSDHRGVRIKHQIPFQRAGQVRHQLVNQARHSSAGL
jgi:serine/threonine protein kinase